MLRFYSFTLLMLFLYSCESGQDNLLVEPEIYKHELKTKNVVILVADGLRYTESWGQSGKKYIPNIADYFSKIGIVNTMFYNLGDTYSLSGHSSIITGYYQTLDNFGFEKPAYPSIFQYFNKIRKREQIKSWVIASKDKLAVLGNCEYPEYKDKFMPLLNVGIEGKGLGSGYRIDSITKIAAIDILKQYQPNLVLINFQNPDESAHTGSWESYIEGIKSTDKYIAEILKFLNSDEFYKNTTTVFITSDHGRHSNGIFDSFVSHGCSCDGCRHISFFTFGPDFKNNLVITKRRHQLDLAVTVAYLLGFNLPGSKGELMHELFETAK